MTQTPPPKKNNDDGLFTVTPAQQPFAPAAIDFKKANDEAAERYKRDNKPIPPALNLPRDYDGEPEHGLHRHPHKSKHGQTPH